MAEGPTRKLGSSLSSSEMSETVADGPQNQAKIIDSSQEPVRSCGQEGDRVSHSVPKKCVAGKPMGPATTLQILQKLYIALQRSP